MIERSQPLVAHDTDGPLKNLGISKAQAQADLKRLGELVKSRQREQASELESMHRRYLQATCPLEGSSKA